MASMETKMPASRARSGAWPRCDRIQRALSIRIINGSEASMVTHSPIRTVARTPMRSRGRAPRIWAITGDTAMPGPLPISQAK